MTIICPNPDPETASGSGFCRGLSFEVHPKLPEVGSGEGGVASGRYSRREGFDGRLPCMEAHHHVFQGLQDTQLMIFTRSGVVPILNLVHPSRQISCHLVLATTKAPVTGHCFTDTSVTSSSSIRACEEERSVYSQKGSEILPFGHSTTLPDEVGGALVGLNDVSFRRSSLVVVTLLLVCCNRHLAVKSALEGGLGQRY